jgi:phosphohistidine phosphatase SixA
MKRRDLFRSLAVLCIALAAAGASADEAVWKLLQGGGQVVMVRHALTDPGVGDPSGMKLEDCSTQRNLNEEGRRDARRLGDALRARQVPVAGVLSSPWCRALETARLVLGRPAQVQPALGNLFGRPELAADQVAQLRRIARQVPRGGNLFLFTHGSTTQALTGISPATSEMVVLTPRGDGFHVAGQLTVH